MTNVAVLEMMFNSVVKESSFKQQQDRRHYNVCLEIAAPPSQPTSSLVHLFPPKVKPKNFLGQDCLKMGKKISLCFGAKS